MIEQIREKNRNRLVTAAFRSKFLKQPSTEQLSHWVTVFQSDPDLPRFLAQISKAAASGQSLPAQTTVIEPTKPITHQSLNANQGTPRREQHKLGARASFFYGQLQRSAGQTNAQGVA